MKRVLMLLFLTSIAAVMDKVRPEEVKVLTLSKNKMTTGRRNRPMPQLTCKGRLCSEFTPATVLCLNMGTDGRDVQWKCEADMPDGYRFGTIDVSCEGYNYPDDPYILAGSCGLTYTLEGPGQPHKASHNPYYSDVGSTGSSGSSWGSLVWWAAIVVLVYAVLRVWKGHSGRGGGGGGFRPDPWVPPRGAPPPYTDAGANCAPPTSGFGAAPSQGPGFWSGMLGGGALGYMMGNRNQRNQASNLYAGQRHGAGLSSRYTTGSQSSSHDESESSRSGGGVRTAYGTTSRR